MVYVCVNATNYEYPLEAKGASLSPGGVDNTIAGNPERPELDTDPERSGELLGVQCWEAQGENRVLKYVVDVQGRLRQNLNFWQHTLQAPNNVLECIQIGYKLPLQYLPDPFSQSNHKSSLVHKSFVTEAVAELLANRCVN